MNRCRFELARLLNASSRLCAALVAWLDQYPGDFVAPATFALLKPFLESLVITVHVAHYAIELLPLLTGVSRMHDPESTWALPDRVDTEMAFSSPTPHTAQDRKMSLVPSLTSTRSGSSMQHGTSTDAHTTSLIVPSTLSDGETMPPYAKDGAASHETLPKTSSDLQVKQGYAGLTRDRSKSDAGTSSSRDAPASTSSSIGQVPSRINVLLDMSNRVAELPDDLLAAQITRMCWEIYSDMKVGYQTRLVSKEALLNFYDMQPRDLIRYVLAPRDPKNPSVAHRDSRGPVARAIALSNQISDWSVPFYSQVQRLYADSSAHQGVLHDPRPNKAESASSNAGEVHDPSILPPRPGQFRRTHGHSSRPHIPTYLPLGLDSGPRESQTRPQTIPELEKAYVNQQSLRRLPSRANGSVIPNDPVLVSNFRS